MPNAQSVGNPHPDATGMNKAAGIDVLLILQYKRKNIAGPTYMVRTLSCHLLCSLIYRTGDVSVCYQDG